MDNKGGNNLYYSFLFCYFAYFSIYSTYIVTYAHTACITLLFKKINIAMTNVTNYYLFNAINLLAPSVYFLYIPSPHCLLYRCSHYDLDDRINLQFIAQRAISVSPPKIICNIKTLFGYFKISTKLQQLQLRT